MPRTAGRELAFKAFRRRAGEGLERFATWAVLAEQHGPHFPDWPAELQHPGSAQVGEFTALHADDIDFVCWLQWVLDEQLAADPGRRASRPGWGWASCTTWRSACTRAGPTPGRLQDTYAQGIAWGRRRIRTTRTGRTGASRRGGRTGWPTTAYAPYPGDGVAPSCGTPAASGSTT